MPVDAMSTTTTTASVPSAAPVLSTYAHDVNAQLASCMERVYAQATRPDATPHDRVPDDTVTLCASVSLPALRCFCDALRACPLPLCGSAASAAILPGATVEVLRLLDVCRALRSSGDAATAATDADDALALGAHVSTRQTRDWRVACSPFRFAGTRAFHHQLRDACTAHLTNTTTTMLTRLDALVHGWTAPTASSPSALRCARSAHTTAASRAHTSRKRPRDAALVRGDDDDNNNDDNHDATNTRRVARADVPLHCRLDENATLLDELLTTTRTTTTAATTTTSAARRAHDGARECVSAIGRDAQATPALSRSHAQQTHAQLPHRLQRATAATTAADATYGTRSEDADDTEDSRRRRVCALDACRRAVATSDAPSQQQQQQPQQPLQRQGRVEAPHVFVQAHRARSRTATTTTTMHTSALDAVPWQLLVDTRERVAGQHARMLASLRALQVPCTTVALPAGDFAINVQLDDGHATDTTRRERDNVDAAATTHVDTTSSNKSGSHAASSSSLLLLSHVLALVVERKTEDDLDASIKGRRYGEQRQLLSSSPFACVVWLVEATPYARQGGRSGGNGARRAHRQGGVGSSNNARRRGGGDERDGNEDAASAAQRRVLAACTSLAQQPRFVVVRTRSVAESCQFLRALAHYAVRDVAAAVAASRRRAHAATMTCARAPFVWLPLCASEESDKDDNDDDGKRRSNGCWAAPTTECLAHVASLQKQLRAQTAFPRMLLCVRGCAPQLALLLVRKYGTLYALWQRLRRDGHAVCDADRDIQALPLRQKKVFVLLTEFVLAKHYA